MGGKDSRARDPSLCVTRHSMKRLFDATDLNFFESA